MALARSLGTGKSATMMARMTEEESAAPRPCANRALTKRAWELAAPHATDDSVNSATAVAKTRRVPKRSAIQPLIGMKTARLSV